MVPFFCRLLLRLIEEPLRNIFGYELVAEKHVNEDGGRFSLVGKVTELYPRLCADVAGDDTNHRTYVPDRRYSNLHSHCETIHGGQNTDGLDETLQGIFHVICMLLLLSPDNVMEESQLCKRLSDLATYPPSYPGSSFHTSHSRRLNIASQDSAEEAWKMLIQQEFVPQSLLHRSKVAVEGLSGTDNRGASKFVYSLGPAYRPRTGGLATMSVLDNLRTVKQMTDGRPVAAAETTSDQGSREVATGGTDVSVHATNSENANAVRLPAVPRQFFRKRTRNGDIGSGYRVTTTSYSSASGGGVVDIISIDDEDEHVSEGAGVHGDSDQGRAVTDGGANAEPVVMHCPEPTAKRLQVFLGREVGGFAMWYPKQGDASEAESTAAQR